MSGNANKWQRGYSQHQYSSSSSLPFSQHIRQNDISNQHNQHCRNRSFVLNDENLSNLEHNNNNDDKYGEKDDDIQSCYSIETQAFMLPNPHNHQFNASYNISQFQYRNRYKTSNKVSKSCKTDKIKIEKHWRLVPMNINDDKIAQIRKYGVREKRNCTIDEYVIYYGYRILHTNIYNDIIAYYEGSIEDWMHWFHLYLENNTNYYLKYNNKKVLTRIDLFGSSRVKEFNLSIKDYQPLGYDITLWLCKHGWLEGLKYLIEEKNINHIYDCTFDEYFQLLLQSTYYFHDDILKYILLQNSFHSTFDIDHVKNRYNETLWESAMKHFQNSVKSGTGWMHCLESTHYAPYLIQEIYGDDDDDDDDDKEEKCFDDEGNDSNNWMVKQLKDINVDNEILILPKDRVDERLNIINCLIDNKQKTLIRLESCYYGLCVDAKGQKAHLLQLWLPHINKSQNQSFEYIPCEYNNNWGRIRALISNKLYITADPKTNMVKFCQFMYTDNQLWKIEQVVLQNTDNIWIRIINKAEYKLIISWKNHINALSSEMTVLSISDKINEIDPLCRDIFSVCKDSPKSTKHYLYYEKYKNITSVGGYLWDVRDSGFWRLSVDGSKILPNKCDCYKNKLKNIAKILYQYKQRYLKSLNNNNNNSNSQQKLNMHHKRRKKTKRLSPPPPPSNNMQSQMKPHCHLLQIAYISQPGCKIEKDLFGNDQLIIPPIDKETFVTLKQPQLMGNNATPFQISFEITFPNNINGLKWRKHANRHGGIYFGHKNISNNRWDGHCSIGEGAKCTVIDWIDRYDYNYDNDHGLRIYGIEKNKWGVDQWKNVKQPPKDWKIIFEKNNKCDFYVDDKFVYSFKCIDNAGYVGFWMYGKCGLYIRNLSISKIYR